MAVRDWPGKSATFKCRFCGDEVALTGRGWDAVLNEALFHFSACTPPRMGVPTTELLAEAERLANEMGRWTPTTP